MTLRKDFIHYCNLCFEGGMVIDEQNQSAMKQIFDVFEANKAGVMVIGQTGSGKSLIFEVLHRILHPKDEKRFRIESAMDIVHDYNTCGSEVFELFKQKRNFVIDDLGIENLGRFYGTDCNVIEDIIQIRYNLFKSNGFKTHFTTNLNVQEIFHKYGARVFSRLGEMCDIVVLGGETEHTDRRRYRNFLQWFPVQHAPTISEADALWYERYRAMQVNRGNMTKAELEDEQRNERKERMGFGNNPAFIEFKKTIVEP